ncbi:uncharacterized protein [Panulirus ornatus]|uniref:uncharacterized protein n=1 Tax=Panulirus ornatus TaxID=150431 RepID=UPI003A839C6F
MISSIVTVLVLLLVYVHNADCKIVTMDLVYEDASPSQEQTRRLTAEHARGGLEVFREAVERLVNLHITENRQAARVSATTETYVEWLSYLLSASLAHRILSVGGSGSSSKSWTTPSPQPQHEPGYLPSFGQQFPSAFSALLKAVRGTTTDDEENTSVRDGGDVTEREGGRPLPSVRRRREDSGVMYLPVSGGGSSSSCPSYADTVASSLTQMAFASMALTVFNAVANILNNINNNNQNNNINSNSNVASNNANVASNSNNGNQVNVVLPPPIPGRRRRDVQAARRVDEALIKMQLARLQVKTSHVTGIGLGDSQVEGSGVLHVAGINGGGNKGANLLQDWTSGGKVDKPKGNDGCVSRKAYARAALATLHVMRDYITSLDKNRRGTRAGAPGNTGMTTPNPRQATVPLATN